MDGWNEFPNRLMAIKYFQNEKYPNTLSLDNTRGGMTSSDFMFQVNEWYKELFASHVLDGPVTGLQLSKVLILNER